MESGGNYVIGASLGDYYCKTTTMVLVFSIYRFSSTHLSEELP